MANKVAMCFLALGLLSTSACASSEGDVPGYTAVGASGGAASGGGGTTSGTGGTAGSAGQAGAAGSGGSDVPLDYSNGSWTLENLSQTPGTISHDGRLVFVGGEQMLAWSEPDSVNLSDQDIFAGPAGQTKAVTHDTEVQNAYPALAAVDDTSMLVFSGYADGDHDVYFATGPDFATIVNLTTSGDSETTRDDFAPAFAACGTKRAVAYLSELTVPSDQNEVRVLEWNGAPSAFVPTTVLAGKGTCDDPAIACDEHGKLHVLAGCGGLFEERTYYATNASGAWQVTDISPTTLGNMDTRVALSPDGKSIHALWLDQNLDLRFTSAQVGSAFEPPKIVVKGGLSPELAVDSTGRVLIAFHRMNAQNMADLFFVWIKDGLPSVQIALTPNTEASDQWLPSAIVFEPGTGYPEVLYVEIEPNSNPVNSDVWRAKFQPKSD